MKTVISYRGCRLDEMSKEELIEVVQFTFEEAERVRNESTREREFLLNLRRTD